MLSLIWIVFAVLGLVAAAADLAAYRIPNWGTLAFFLLFGVVAALRGAQIPWADHLGAFAVCLAGGILFFALKQVGAGDAKLFAVLALWSGFGALLPLLFWIAVAGLAELAVILGLRRLLPKLRSRFPQLDPARLPRVLTKRQGVPFGVGIAAGAIIASFWFPAWLWIA
jgi:prepilin peptidase CpaA